MSQEQASKFIEKTENDVSLQAKIKGVKKGDWEAFSSSPDSKQTN